MKFEVKYKEADSKWEEITEKDLRKKLKGNFINIQYVIDHIKKGNHLQTSFAIYRYK